MDDNIINFSPLRSRRRGVPPGEQALSDAVYAAMQTALDNGLTASQVIGVLHFVVENLTRSASE